MPDTTKNSLNQLAKSVRLLILDVDGVLTDGTITYDQKGQQIQTFHVHDGLGIKLLQGTGVDVAIISARKSAALEKRASELAIRHFFSGIDNKAEVFNNLLDKLAIDAKTTAFAGDDWIDIPIMKRCGLPIAVANARDEVKAHARYITKACGGQGAVREICELIIAASGKFEECISHFTE